MIKALSIKGAKGIRKKEATYKVINAIVGPPGTGKTTTIGRVVREHWQTGESVMVCSLTKAAAAEAAGRNMPIAPEMIGTLHSHAYRALGRPDVVEAEHIAEWNARHPEQRLSGAGTDADDPFTDAPETDGDALLAAVDLRRHRRDPEEAWEDEEKSFRDAWMEFKRECEVMDFTDMIQIAELTCPTAPGCPWHLIVDEAQDLSRLELDLLRRWATSARSLTIVGDPYQSLYTWRGAHPGMFGAVGSIEVLSQSYRVPRAIHEAAVEWVSGLSDFDPRFAYHPTSEDGEVDTIPATWREPGAVVGEILESIRRGESVMVQASTSFLIAPTVRALRDAGIPYSNPWRVKRGDWNPLAPRNGGALHERLMDLLRPLQEERVWTIREMASWTGPIKATGTLTRGARGEIEEAYRDNPGRMVDGGELEEWLPPNVYLGLMDAYESGRAVEWYMDRLPDARRTYGDYIASVVNRFGEDGLTAPRCYVGTIHSFKGAEADTVIVYPDLSRKAVEEDDTDAVIRMGYVAMTRAKRRLVVAEPVKQGMGLL